MTTAPNTTDPGSGVIAALHVSGPAPEHADKLMLFGRFVGSWNLHWTGGSPPATATGELHVGWVLGGRAVQDIWIVPGRGQPGHNQPPLAFHGTTIRFYDPTIDAWRSTWIEPINGRVRRFIGAPDGQDIVLLSDEDAPNYAGASPTSNRTRSRGKPKRHTTVGPPGTSTRKCSPPAQTTADPRTPRQQSQPAIYPAGRSLGPRGVRNTSVDQLLARFSLSRS